jgi:glycosyltransferase 2 family protein
MEAKKLIKRILLFIGLAILIFFIYKIDLRIIKLSVQALGNGILLLLGLTVLNISTKALRWKLLIKSMTGKKISLWFAFNSILAGVAAGSFIPGRIELAKPLMLKTQHDVRVSESLSALAIERVMDLFSLLLILVISIFLLPQQNIISLGLVIALAIVLISATILITVWPQPFISLANKIIMIVPVPRKFRFKSKEFMEFLFGGFRILKKKLFVMVITLLSWLSHSLEVARFYFLLNLLGVEASLAIAGFVFAAAIIIGVVTMIPGGIGITEMSGAGLLAILLPGTPAGLLKSSILIDRLIAYYLLLLVGGVILMFYDKMFKSNPEVHKPFKEN